jgi:uncharacterized membrane protein
MNLSIRKIVMSGILGAVSILLGVTGLGFIPVPTPAGHATIMHVPAILGGVLEGPVVGLLTGAIFGIFSFLRATSPLFTDPLVAIFPRLFIGVTAYYAYIATKTYESDICLCHRRCSGNGYQHHSGSGNGNHQRVSFQAVLL